MIIGLCVLILNIWYIDQDMSGGDEVDKFYEIPMNIQISNIGSSHGGCDFDYRDIKDHYTCFNLGLTAQSLSYDFRVIMNYEENFEEGGIMFVPISYFSFFGIDETLREEFESQNKRYYKILSPEYIKNYDLKTELLVKEIPVLIQYHKLLMMVIEKLNWYIQDLIPGRVETGEVIVHSVAQAVNEPPGEPERVATNEMNSDMVKSAGEAFKRHIARHMDESGKMIVNEEEINALKDIVLFCKNKNIKPILITTPYTNEYNQIVQEQVPWFMEEFYGIVHEIQDETGVEYYDYATDNRFCGDYSLFRDSDHLNQDGEVKFVDILMEELVDSNF